MSRRQHTDLCQASDTDLCSPAPRSPDWTALPSWLLSSENSQGYKEIANVWSKSALTAAVVGFDWVPPAGFEPATHGLGNRRSIP